MSQLLISINIMTQWQMTERNENNGYIAEMMNPSVSRPTVWNRSKEPYGMITRSLSPAARRVAVAINIGVGSLADNLLNVDVHSHCVERWVEPGGPRIWNGSVNW